MLYRILKIISRIAIRIYCRKIVINKPEILNTEGPVLIAANHPNSFLDSVILNTLFEKDIWALARGDVFRKPFFAKLLHSLNILPVYRTSEGSENLNENYKTFEACTYKLKENAIIKIYSEGLCVNEWHLRTLKKGTARLAIRAWEEGIPLKVLPAGINYSSFRKFGKNVFLNFGEFITIQDMNFNGTDGLRHQQFNCKLQEQLSRLVYEIDENDIFMKKKILTVPQNITKRILLFYLQQLDMLLICHYTSLLNILPIVKRKRPFIMTQL
ncbi:MAG: 1-acyl-sn-glycerol-3-phosphate acyltransferase [Chitinophagaceae bacterium]|nr:1-acyl-sn-glycerol-3-phosphate acyltransferase [Chitinophagaceae bacterium]